MDPACPVLIMPLTVLILDFIQRLSSANSGKTATPSNLRQKRVEVAIRENGISHGFFLLGKKNIL